MQFPWKEYYTEKYVPFYYNAYTKESKFEKPAITIEKEDDDGEEDTSGSSSRLTEMTLADKVIEIREQLKADGYNFSEDILVN